MLIRVMSDIHNEFCHEQSGSDYLVPELDDDKDSILITFRFGGPTSKVFHINRLFINF